MIRIALIAALATPAAAQENIHVWPGTAVSGHIPSTIELHDPRAPNAVASLTFHNTEVHALDEALTLTWHGITLQIGVEFQGGDYGAEVLTIIAPPGYVAVPPELTVPEKETRVSHIYKFEGM